MSIQVSQASETKVTPVSTAKKRDAYLQGLLAAVKEGVPTGLALASLRGTAEALVSERSFPSSRDEDWRFADLSAMLATSFKVGGTTVAIDADAIAPLLLSEAKVRLVFVNGLYNADLSSTEALPEGAIVGNLATLYSNSELQGKLDQRLGQQSGAHEVFTALNTAGFQDAVVVWVPRNQVVETPIQVIYVSVPQAEAAIASPRCLVVAESGSALTLVEEFWGMGTGAHFTNAVSEIWVDDNAEVIHIRVQREGADTFHIGKTVATQARDSRYRCTAISLGDRKSVV